MMADRTNAAETLDDDGNFPIHPPLMNRSNPLNSTIWKRACFDFAILVQPDGDLAVTFDASDRIDYDLSRPCLAWTSLMASAGSCCMLFVLA